MEQSICKMVALVCFAFIAVGSMGDACAASQPRPSSAQLLKPMPSCKEAAHGGPEDRVLALYAAFPFGGKPVDQEPERVLTKFFGPELTRQFLRNQQCLKNTHEVCDIDAAVLYGAQGGDITDFKVCEVSDKHTVDAQFRVNGEPKVVSYYMVDTTAGWRVEDIVYHTDAGKLSWVETFRRREEQVAASWRKAQADKVPVVPPKNARPLPQCEIAKSGGPEDLVRKLHDQYPWNGNRIIIDEPKNVLLTYFDENLASVIAKHHEKAGDGFLGMPNIIVNHDEAESLNAISGFHICTMDAASKTVRVQFYNDSSPRVVAYKFSSTKAGWRISDIRLLSVNSLVEGDYDWSLVEGLSDD